LGFFVTQQLVVPTVKPFWAIFEPPVTVVARALDSVIVKAMPSSSVPALPAARMVKKLFGSPTASQE